MVEVVRDLWSSSVQHPAQEGPLRASCPQLCPGGFCLSPGMETLPPPWQPVAVLAYPHRKKCLLILRENLLCFSLYRLL